MLHPDEKLENVPVLIYPIYPSISVTAPIVSILVAAS